ncbi:asparagine--tRNA ligase [Engelhardtia mirabilis]|uniref:Asparagine--tRNA ligase n=1 Tax=Engelhardtia mirabilis TaxID=2528011 RepID=A0A518BJZ4_9BACT|nr:Asparagine--tRNA ligase [Planctomycetes bacterium Pla133]QDV01618.1 Asparagine--tRNA ligase [Planctomycetes bacterium Pla86]
MATITTVSQLANHVGESVTLQGWIANKSSKGKLHFVQFRDGSGFCQCVLFVKNVSPELFEEVGRAGQESSIVLTGEVKADERAPGGFEVSVTDGRVLQNAVDYPITPKEHGADFLLSNRHLWLRSKRQWAIIRVRDAVAMAIRRFFDGRGFINLDAPMFTPNACEGTSNLFELDYFERKAYLTQSGQLYGEAGAMAHGRIYTFGPTFRAEKSKTRRHLTEFWMMEPEVAFADLGDVMELAEDMLCFVVQEVLERRRTELEVLERDLSKLECIQKPFPRLKYAEAAKILLEHPDSEFVDGDDLGAPDETILSNMYDRPLMITHYPAEVKSFYMKRDPEDPSKALCVDVLGTEGVGEMIGGSQREDDLDTLLERIREHDLPEQYFQWYLDLRRYGSVPHSGFGLGLERTVAWICGIEHVREAIPFPRMMYRIEP